MVHWTKKILCYRIELKERGSPLVHLSIWIFKAPGIQNEDVYIELVEKTINTQLCDHLNNPELIELVKTYWKYNKNKCRFSYGQDFTKKVIIAAPLDSKFSDDAKQEVLARRNTLIK